jgi:hypothetical protein
MADLLKIYLDKLWLSWNLDISIKLASKMRSAVNLKAAAEFYDYSRLVYAGYPGRFFFYSEGQKIKTIREMRRHLRFMGITTPKMPKEVSLIAARYKR